MSGRTHGKKWNDHTELLLRWKKKEQLLYYNNIWNELIVSLEYRKIKAYSWSLFFPSPIFITLLKQYRNGSRYNIPGTVTPQCHTTFDAAVCNGKPSSPLEIKRVPNEANRLARGRHTAPLKTNQYFVACISTAAEPAPIPRKPLRRRHDVSNRVFWRSLIVVVTLSPGGSAPIIAIV